MENHESESIRINPIIDHEEELEWIIFPFSYQNNYIQCNMFIAFMNIYLIVNIYEAHRYIVIFIYLYFQCRYVLFLYHASSRCAICSLQYSRMNNNIFFDKYRFDERKNFIRRIKYFLTCYLDVWRNLTRTLFKKIFMCNYFCYVMSFEYYWHKTLS